jgi:hypothetical protein
MESENQKSNLLAIVYRAAHPSNLFRVSALPLLMSACVHADIQHQQVADKTNRIIHNGGGDDTAPRQMSFQMIWAEKRQPLLDVLEATDSCSIGPSLSAYQSCRDQAGHLKTTVKAEVSIL